MKNFNPYVVTSTIRKGLAYVTALLMAFSVTSATGLHHPDSTVQVSSLSTTSTLLAQRSCAPLQLFAVQTPKKKWFEAIRYSGNARFVAFYRNMNKHYEVSPDLLGGLTMPRNLTAGDGTQQPLLLLAMEANPTQTSMFKFELNFDHLLLRQTYRTNTAGRLANLFVLFQFQAAVDTRIGHINLTSGGGVNWYRMSQSTFWGYQYRDDLFERYPWEPDVHDFERYDYFYQQGDIPRDARFGMQPTQGFILEGSNMPGGFEAAFVFGKNTQTGGFQSYQYRDPQKMIATRLGKNLGDHKVGVNVFDQSGYTTNKVNYAPVVQELDTFYVKDNYVSTHITTLDFKLGYDDLTVYSELGLGSYLSSTYNNGLKNNAKPGVANIKHFKRDWDETLFIEFSSKKGLTHFPMKLNMYRIGKHVVNPASSVYNTSVETYLPNTLVPQEYNGNYYDGMVTEVGQLANNRQGVNFTAFINSKALKNTLDLGFSQEIENLVGDTRNGARADFSAGAGEDSTTRVPFTNSFTFHQRLNGVSRSRFAFYRRFTGPYGRIAPTFRRTFENIAITDTLVDYKKSFSNFEYELKYKTRVLGRELIITNFIDISTVQENWSPIPVLSDKAFLRYFYEELIGFYAIHPKVTVVGFVGLERAIGNSRTELADENGDLITDDQGRPIASETGKAIDQRGLGFGMGLDYNFADRASLHIKSRWYTHRDVNFIQDEFAGNEITFEFKKFF